MTDSTDNALKPCPGCGSTLGPFLSAPEGKEQVICSTCGMRGPYETLVAAARKRWADLAPDPLADARVRALVEAVQTALNRGVIWRDETEREFQAPMRCYEALHDALAAFGDKTDG